MENHRLANHSFLRHDDGSTKANTPMLSHQVRTSKTPTSLYLSCNNNLKVANVPIIEGIRPPDKMFTASVQKVGLTISPERLAFIRERRLKYAGDTDYLDISHIKRELEYCHRIFNQIRGLQVIDVTNSSIEEVANKIIESRQEITNNKGRR
jgi:regulator of PEP synthase PpsR (kinase-PPPase family)